MKTLGARRPDFFFPRLQEPGEQVKGRRVGGGKKSVGLRDAKTAPFRLSPRRLSSPGPVRMGCTMETEPGIRHLVPRGRPMLETEGVETTYG